jgi:aminopeptidase-like protein
MRLLKEIEQTDPAEIGQELHCFAAELYPICRSITGDGIRRTLALIQHRIPLQIVEVPTGTTVFDWTIPKELTGCEFCK